MELIRYIKKLISLNIDFIKDYQKKKKAKENAIFMMSIYDETKKDLRKKLFVKPLSLRTKIILAIVLVGIFAAILIIIKQEDIKINEKEFASEKPDTTDSLMITFAEVAGLNNLAITQEKIYWTAQSSTLILANAKTINVTYESIKKIEKFFEIDGWVNEPGDFNYVSKDGRGGVGYIAPKDEGYRFKSAMCIIYSAENKMSCGWMPSK